MSTPDTAVEVFPPFVLGRRLFWNRVTLPMTEVRSMHTDDRDINEWGFHADLATENGVTVTLAYDPGSCDESRELNRQRGETVSLWLGVRHPITESLCAARIEGDRAVYDFWCGDENGCDHEHGGWWEYVRSPEDVLDRLPHLGRLRIKAIQVSRAEGSHDG